MNFLVVGGAAKSFGILYVEFIDKYGTSSSGTLSVVALSQSLCMLLGQSSHTSHNMSTFSDILVEMHCCTLHTYRVAQLK